MRARVPLAGCLLAGILMVAVSAGHADSLASPKSGKKSFPRGPYLLRRIFGDDRLSAPAVWGIAPGVRRSELPEGADLGHATASERGLVTYSREVGAYGNVLFVFDGRDSDPRLDHVTVTLFQSPRINWEAIHTHLTKVFGPCQTLPHNEEGVARWQQGAVVLDYFQSARFFEVTLSAPSPENP